MCTKRDTTNNYFKSTPFIERCLLALNSTHAVWIDPHCRVTFTVTYLWNLTPVEWTEWSGTAPHINTAYSRVPRWTCGQSIQTAHWHCTGQLQTQRRDAMFSETERDRAASQQLNTTMRRSLKPRGSVSDTRQSGDLSIITAGFTSICTNDHAHH